MNIIALYNRRQFHSKYRARAFQRPSNKERTERKLSIRNRTQLLLRKYPEIRRFKRQERDWIKTGSSRGRLCHYYIQVGNKCIGVVKRSYAHPVERHDLAFGIANSKRRVQPRRARPSIWLQTGKKYGFVRKADHFD